MIYEYACECGNIEDINMKMTDDHPKEVVCSKCEKMAYRKLAISVVIPDHMRAGDGTNQIRYDRSSQIHGRKYF